MRAFIAKLRADGALPADAADALAELTPASYVGMAPQLAAEVRKHLGKW